MGPPCDRRITELIAKVLKSRDQEDTHQAHSDLVEAFRAATADDVAMMDPVFVKQGKQLADKHMEVASNEMAEAQQMMSAAQQRMSAARAFSEKYA